MAYRDNINASAIAVAAYVRHVHVNRKARACAMLPAHDYLYFYPWQRRLA